MHKGHEGAMLAVPWAQRLRYMGVSENQEALHRHARALMIRTH